MEIVPILHNIRSAYNVGAVLRSADATGIKRIYCTGYTPRLPHSKIEKTALGAQDTVKIPSTHNLIDVVRTLKEEGFQIIAVEQTPKSKSLYESSFPQKVALILGNEVTGLSTSKYDLADKHIELPMIGLKKSLNVSICASIVFYSLIYSYSGVPLVSHI